jgi:DNA-binding response OmpR family regulator
MSSLVRLHPPTDATPSCRLDADLRGRYVVLVSLAGRPLVGLRRALAGAGARAVDACELSAARRRAAVLGPRATVVIDLPDNAGPVIAAMSAFRAQDAVLVLTATASRAERIALLRAGADHVLRTDEPGELIACLLAVLRRVRGGEVVLTADLLQVGDLRLDHSSRMVTSAGRCLSLTPLEFHLLAYFMAKAGQALTRERLLADVWGYDIGGLDTVTVSVRRLRMKIEVDPSRPVLLRTVWGTGYRLEAEGAFGHQATAEDAAPMPTAS